MKILHRIATGLVTTGLVLAGSVSLGSVARASEPLLVRYDTRSTCTVYMNYPKDGVIQNETWTIPAGHKRIIWRYNVNSVWAAVSDPARAGQQFPWWGFTRKDCIVGAPQRILEGRSRSKRFPSGWRPVIFSVPPVPITAHHQEIKHDATVRDPANFVIGNVRPTWHVDVTSKTRSNGSWVEVYVPNAKRWGYVESSALR